MKVVLLKFGLKSGKMYKFLLNYLERNKDTVKKKKKKEFNTKGNM